MIQIYSKILNIKNLLLINNKPRCKTSYVNYYNLPILYPTYIPA